MLNILSNAQSRGNVCIRSTGRNCAGRVLSTRHIDPTHRPLSFSPFRLPLPQMFSTICSPPLERLHTYRATRCCWCPSLPCHTPRLPSPLRWSGHHELHAAPALARTSCKRDRPCCEPVSPHVKLRPWGGWLNASWGYFCYHRCE